MYKVVKSSHSTSKCRQWHALERCAVIEFIVAMKELVENIRKAFSNVNGSARVHRSTTARWKKRSLSKQKKHCTMICLTLAILSQLLTLRHCYMLMPSFNEINTSQSDNWQSVFQSAQEVLVISSMILDIRIFTFVHETLFLAASWMNTKQSSSESGFHFQQEKRICLAWGQVNQVGGWSPYRNSPSGGASTSWQNDRVVKIQYQLLFCCRF
jgi:predicted transcriptional regulator